MVALALLGVIFALLTKLYKDDEEAKWWVNFFRKVIGITFLTAFIINIILLLQK